MRRLAVALLAGTMMLAGPAMVQANEGCPMCGAKMDSGNKADKLAILLDLSDKQKEQVKALADRHAEKMKPMHEDMMKKMEAAKEEFKAGLDKILTGAQRTKLEKWKEIEKAHWKDHGMKMKE